MADILANGDSVASNKVSLKTPSARTKKRNAAEKRFRFIGASAVGLGVFALFGLLLSIFGSGLSSFNQTFITVDIHFDEKVLDPTGERDPEKITKILTFKYKPIIQDSMQASVIASGANIDDVSAKQMAAMLSKGVPARLRADVNANNDLIGTTRTYDLLANGRIDGYYKDRVKVDDVKLGRIKNISYEMLLLADAMKQSGMLETKFNWKFFTNPDASVERPESAGLGVALQGSAYMMFIVLFLALPIGVAASIYLEEFAPKNRFTDLIEVNISNLAAVPSIVFGILGLAVFINFAGMPRSAPIVGGLVLTLMTLPTIIIAARAALKAVPPSIRSAAMGVGASPLQTVFHHVLPLAMPGILTGTIIGLAQALGESAPLLLIGMVAFVKEYPSAPPEGLFDPAAALPVQVYNWTQRSDPAFVERASGAIIVLLGFLIFMNLIAIILRKRFERRW